MASLRIKDSKMSIMELGIIVTVDGEVITEDGEILEDSNPLHLSHLNKEVGDNKAEEIQADGGSKVEETRTNRLGTTKWRKRTARLGPARRSRWKQ
jgi:hypothetical protein